MPTTIYDASQITKRIRDKIIAKEVQQRNSTGQSIITPQTGYSAYLNEEKNNGDITYFRKNGECTNINLACKCYSNNTIRPIICSLLTSQDSLGYQDIFLQIQIPSNCLSGIQEPGFIQLFIQGTFTINWGDGNIESFISPNSILLINHVYNLPGQCAQYIIGITGDIIVLNPTGEIIGINSLGTGCIYSYPRPVSTTLIRVPLLTSLYLNSDILEKVNGLNNCTSLVNFQLSDNDIDFSPIYSFSNLNSLALQNNKRITTSFNANGLTSLQTLQLNNNISLSTIIGLNTLVNLTGLDIRSCPFNDINLSSNTNLTTLNINYTLLNNTSTQFINSLSLLVNLTELFAAGTLFDSSSNTFLTQLPQTLTYLYLEETKFSGLFNVPPQLTNLLEFVISSTNITSISSLPSTLTVLICNNTLITSLPTLPSTLTNLDCSICNINQLNADNIVANLVTNGTPLGSLIILNQRTGVLSDNGLNWNYLKNILQWVIE